MQAQINEDDVITKITSKFLTDVSRQIPVPPDATPQERRTYYLASLSFPPALILRFFYIFLFAYWGISILVLFNFLSVLVYVIAYMLTRRYRIHLAWILLISEFVVLTALVIYFVGWGIGVQYFLINLVVDVALISWPTWLRWMITVALTSTFLFLYYYALDNPPQVLVDATQLNFVNSIITPFAIMTIAFLMFFAAGTADRLEAQLDIEHDKSEALLNNILPQAIATRLKNVNGTIADFYDGASVLFADVVDFTPLSAKMTAVGLVELLNEVFSDFDTLTAKFGLEKIKTIGDCYMVASGVPQPRSDHAQLLTQMALEMREVVETRTYNGHKLAFRIGINSGPVVAGVIGRKKFAYDLWGDAVNTASRMESHGSGGHIQITRATYDLIRDDFVCEPQGEVEVKGKGKMEVWYVTGARKEQFLPNS